MASARQQQSRAAAGDAHYRLHSPPPSTPDFEIKLHIWKVI